MKTNYTLKNFRIFDKKGATIEIKPMTFLVGCNSSGKSSVVKSLLLLKTFFAQDFNKDHLVIGSSLDFSVKPNDSLGSFSNVINSSSRKKSFSLSYDTHSYYINNDVNVTLTFGEGQLGNATVTGVRIMLKDGSLIADITKKGYKGQLSLIKDAFKKYLIATRFRSQFWGIYDNEYPIGYYGPNKEKHFEQKINKLYQDTLQFCDEDYLQYVFHNHTIETCELNEKTNTVLDKFIETGILSYYSILDDIRNITNPDDINRFLKNKIKDHVTDNTIKGAINKAIDFISENYKESGYEDFLSYYRNLEDNELFNIEELDEIISNSIFGKLRNSGRVNFVYCLSDRFNNMETVELDDETKSISKRTTKELNVYKRTRYWHIDDTFALLSENDPLVSIYYDDIEPSIFHAEHPLYDIVFKQYLNLFLKEVVCKDITNNIAYISSSRIQVRRLYPMEDKNDFSDSVRKYFETKTKFLSLDQPLILTNNKGENTEIVDFTPGCFMNKWLKTFNIGDHISLEMDKNGLGLLLRLHRTESDKKGILLADVGYGITQLFSILLQIEEMIMSEIFRVFKDKSHFNKKISPIVNSRKSLSEILSPQTISIEEPEIHLHPNFQSLLADLFFEAYRDYNIHFIVETHSEYLIRRLQVFVAKQEIESAEISIVYIENPSNNYDREHRVRNICINSDGVLSEPFGPGFFDEARNQAMEILLNGNLLEK